MRILDFDEFSLNESFQSGKLREIIRQNGMPKYDWDKKLLHDLQDSEVIGVMDWGEWDEYHSEHRGECYCVRLENGKYLVLGNVDTLGYFLNDDNIRKEFKKRRDERHPGNEFNDISKGERRYAEMDSFTKDFQKKKDDILHKRNADAMKSVIGDKASEFVSAIREGFEEYFEDVSMEDYEGGKESDIEYEVKFLEKTYSVLAQFKGYTSEGGSSYGAEYFNLDIEPKSFDVYDDEMGDSFDIKEIVDKSELAGLFKEISKEIEGDITDPYEYYGVSRGDFF